MKTQTTMSHYALVFALAGVMALTRFRHGGGAGTLPDASLAVFFLAGWYLRPAWLFAAFFAEAALIDYLAVTYGGVSGDCFSPAYWFLIPTYACLWYGGRWYAARYQRVTRYTLVPLSCAAFFTASLAFVISNAGYYLFSGHVPGMDAMQYTHAVAQYSVPYVAGTLGYLAAAIVLQRVWTKYTEYRRPIEPSHGRYRHE